MFEARLHQSSFLLKILEAIKELLNEATFECTNNGIQLQAMDNSHVSLISLFLSQGGFDKYKCDRNISLGINLTSMLKIMKCAGNDDIVTIQTKGDLDSITFTFESQNYDKVSNYQLRLMNLDHEHLDIPETDYACVMKMPSAEFAHIFKTLLQFGETVEISCSKDGVKFSTSGDLGKANIKLAPNNITDSDKAIFIEIQEPVSATFAIRYLTSFAKATPLALRFEM
ncbi:proliferating cell nuclear antigen isoform X2 [Halyomorpha halys]|uniref:proliferating cell nuclear antigen isoform X2 n=1 Tax=Halyomorpha halys TaxID=286706 RepID=UPI0006D4FEA4|nr:proliferating cell nuclear antigen-like isoform X2 [Halyomorpha halys]